ncbi:homocysteine S-methyltransferase 2 [Physcomitrium patens]|nr:homocysteine S-methyltransferase 2-like isoform X1 [Physcomitrium patens]XP_024364159.1 homocysteine S-methyltransferase 2-like isoform X1 [Physcomitrium patens]XP_024364160.1 homocysteine S-methyltransferase 2-like isoform X1 [Physcomitrium patens]PNR28211.1 hypothetical protein PHYPA_028803 [Physcomitrium patens]|eukprot:XP_024364158.1 homocysteine S-methyltransferase 2-like isoform X1 [Physcomitrella patens]
MGRAVDIPEDKLNALSELLKTAGGCVTTDGGFATQLERHGADINDPLWSASCLITIPELVRKVHREYLEAGAGVISTASYQATIQGFQSRGLSTNEAEDLLQRSVRIAQEERDRVWKESQNREHARTARAGSNLRALVAASIGSYGAYLADGSEYSGDYGPSMTVDKLKDFHRRRLVVLADAGPDLLAIETIPCKLETQALVELLHEEDLRIPAWISFNSKDGVNVVSGDSFSDCVALVDKCPEVAAVGINCTPPRFILDLIHAARKVTNKPIVVYPNSGEHYDPVIKQWVESTGITDTDFVSYVHEWRKAGAQLIGGCCRTTPNTIGAIYKALHEHPHVHVTN